MPLQQPTSQTKKLGALIRKAREDKGLGIRAVADALKINFSSISYLESGQVQRPAAKTLQGLSRLLEIPLEDLYSLAGYNRAEGLPELPVYLRSKYGLTAAEAAEIEEQFRKVAERKKKGGRHAKRSS